MIDKPDMNPEKTKEYLHNWMKKCKEEIHNNPEAFYFREPGIYVGRVKLKNGDKIVKDNNGFPYIIRKHCCE